jgi:hypothetical protein|tara:strand:- start:4225 stop:4632 length:408 start_codon:yes stop_codon:yes gene_type:complete
LAKFVLTDASVVLNSVDLSDHVSSVTLEITSDEIVTTAMGDTFQSRTGGLKDGTLSIEFQQDFASSEVDATLFPLLGSTTAFVVKPTSGSVSSTNPSYAGNVLVNSHSPVANGVGELATMSVSFPTSGTITRATS